MTDCCVKATDDYFDPKWVQHQLKRYHKKGPTGSTRILVDALKNRKLSEMTLLDIGGGMGILTHELLRHGLKSALIVEMSKASIEVAAEEAKRQGHEEQVSFMHGDFVDQHTAVPGSLLVALDRVVCCYPDAENLLDKVTSKSNNLLALSYPRSTWYMRLAFSTENLQRKIFGHAFRAFIHAEKDIRAWIRKRGFNRQFFSRTLTWNVEVYSRDQ